MIDNESFCSMISLPVHAAIRELEIGLRVQD